MDPYVGEIRAFAFDYAPMGWAFCDGSELPIAQYQVLFAVIGKTYGGNGTTTFKLPDFRTAVPVGMGSGPGLTPRTIGALPFGNSTVQLGQEHFAPHTHRVAGRARTTNQTETPGPDVFISNPGASSFYAQTNPGDPRAPMATTMIASAGNAVTSSRNNEQPYQTVNFCIALEGVYPPRQ